MYHQHTFENKMIYIQVGNILTIFFNDRLKELAIVESQRAQESKREPMITLSK